VIASTFDAGLLSQTARIFSRLGDATSPGRSVPRDNLELLQLKSRVIQKRCRAAKRSLANGESGRDALQPNASAVTASMPTASLVTAPRLRAKDREAGDGVAPAVLPASRAPEKRRSTAVLDTA
jgi:hypothetical protein